MRKPLIALVLFFSMLSLAPARAAGLLETLFGGPDLRAASLNVRAYAPNEPRLRYYFDGGPRFQRRAHSMEKKGQKQVLRAKTKRGGKTAHLKFGAKEHQNARAIRGAVSGGKLQHALCCKNGEDPAALIQNDPTLRRGDAYMTKEGLRIYSGQKEAGFVELHKSSSINAQMKARLAAIEQKRPPAAIQGTAMSRGVSHVNLANYEKVTDAAPYGERVSENKTASPGESMKVSIIDAKTQRMFDKSDGVFSSRSLERQIQRTNGLYDRERRSVSPHGKSVRVVGPYVTAYY